ncbi:hypothetical protein L1049_023288 [Liquidambar formosana]|uniref:Cellulose synthase-like protein B3 n=1 Tax=Liquidambar formosana TaxID=63359 RepID=A0AAP0RT38_LIQFO
MANPSSLPLHERITRKNTIQRAFDLILLFLLFSLLVYRIASLNNHGFTWLLAFMCESWFTFLWLLTISTKWNQVEYKTYPDRLSQRVPELPPVDMFVTTADPMLEPPIITVNTVISLLAVDYPANKLACYVSDDGGSPLTFFSLVEASKFAKLWVPFCKKYNIPTRAPFRYFSSESVSSSKNYSSEFKQEWKRMKEEYDELCRKIEEAVQKSKPCDLTGDFAVFSNIERKNHPSIIKVIWENKEGLFNGLPHLVYISREKRPKHPHHYKAGAMNALTRISGVMTNAPFMLNVDCDMFANNPQIVFHSMCLFLGIENERDCAFVQSPQIFYDGLKDDPFGNQYFVLQETMSRGMAGIQAAMYQGTNCFHRRKVIYGLSPDESEAKMRNLSSINGTGINYNFVTCFLLILFSCCDLCLHVLHYFCLLGKFIEKGLDKNFGNSMDFTKSTAETFSGWKVKTDRSNNLSSFLEAARQVAACEYEYSTSWGTKVGWIYGSTTEDILTGMKIHARGWGSVFCTPDPPAFQGCAPSSGLTTMNPNEEMVHGPSRNPFQ